MRAIRGTVAAAPLLVVLLLCATASAHPERVTAFTWPVAGHVPVYRTTGPQNVVCTKASSALLHGEFRRQKGVLRKRLALPLPKCNQLCNLQIEGLGRRPTDVKIVGDRRKTDVVRIDRADGIFLRNFSVEQGAFNDVDLVEVDGFRVSHIVARYAQNYG